MTETKNVTAALTSSRRHANDVIDHVTTIDQPSAI